MGKSKPKHSRHNQPKGSFRRYEAILFPLIIVALIGYFIVTRANGDDTVDENYLIASIAFFMVLMVISIPRGPSMGGSRKRSPRQGKKPSSGKGTKGKKKRPPGKKPAVIEEIEEESIPRERKIISYPGAASGGKYGDAYIAISQEMILKVRSLLAVSCKNCKEVETCWEKYQGQMEYDTFLESTECHERMDPAIISAAPPIQITQEGPEVTEVGVEGVVETGEVYGDEGVVSEEDQAFADDTGDYDEEGSWDETQDDGSGDEGDWGDTQDEESEDEGGWGDTGDEESEDEGDESYDEDEERYQESEEDDDMAWE